MDIQKPKLPVPTPVNLVKYIEDPDFEHEDFTMSAAVTLRARVCLQCNDRLKVCIVFGLGVLLGRSWLSLPK